MVKIKKLLAAFVALALLLSICALSGCRGNDKPADSSSAADISESSSQNETPPVSSDTAEPESSEAPVKLTDAELSRWASVQVDPDTATVDKFNITAADGGWSITIHLCDEDDLEEYRGYYENALASEKNADIVTGEKTLGGYTYKTATYTANGQYFGAYFSAFDSPVILPDDFGEFTGIYCYIWMGENSEAVISAIDAVIDTLQIKA